MRRLFALTIVFISHDLAVVRHVADRVAVMYLGKIVELADSDELFDRPRTRIPRRCSRRSRSRAGAGAPAHHPQGDVPSPLNPPSGCRFHTRCPYARERCRTEEPLLAEGGAGDPHRTACHFWREIPVPENLLPAAEELTVNPHLAKLQSFFTRHGSDGAAAPVAVPAAE